MPGTKIDESNITVLKQHMDAHKAATGYPPNQQSGPIAGTNDTWQAVGHRLKKSNKRMADLVVEFYSISAGCSPAGPCAPNTEYEKLRALIERPREVKLWGQAHTVTPALVSAVFGDGKRLLALCPIDSRPNWYVVRVDSSWDLSGEDSPWVDSHLDSIYDAIEDQFGTAMENEDENAASEPAPWPALRNETGSSWAEEEWPVLEAAPALPVRAVRPRI